MLFLLFRNVDFDSFWSNLQLVNYHWIYFSILISVLAYVTRAYRWNLMLNSLGFTTSLYKSTLVIIISYLANVALPRAGEFLRSGLIKKTDDIPVNVSFGTVIAERVVDLMTLLVLISFALIFEFDILWTFLETTLAIDFRVLVIIIIGGVVVGIASMIFILSLLKKGSFPKLNAFLDGLKEGLISVAKVKKPVPFLLSTVVLWVIYYLMSYTIIFSLETTAHLSATAGLLLLVVGGIAISLPVQSGFGTYHAMIAGLLVVYSIEETTGLFLATLLHTSQIVAVTVFGLISLFLIFLLKKNKDVNVQEGS